MKTFLRAILIISFLVVGTLVSSQSDDDMPPSRDELSTQALNTCSTSNNCDRVNVNRLYVNTNGFLYVSTTGVETDLSCTPSNTDYVRIHNTTANYKEIYTALLSAKLNNMAVTIKLATAGGSNSCNIKHVYLGDL